MSMKILGALVMAWWALIAAGPTWAAYSGRGDLTRYVDPFIGTDGTGHVTPAAMVPFGMVARGWIVALARGVPYIAQLLALRTTQAAMRRGAAEALEAIAHGDAKSSKVVGRRIEQLDLPPGTTIGAIVRERVGGGADVIIAHHDTVIESEDHVIVFVANKRMVPRVEKLFQVGVGFF